MVSYNNTKATINNEEMNRMCLPRSLQEDIFKAYLHLVTVKEAEMGVCLKLLATKEEAVGLW